MKKIKACYRTVHHTQEPAPCIEDKCTAWKDVGGMSGCIFTLNQFLSVVDFINRQSAKEEKPKHESKADSRTGNILEGGDGTPVQHDSNGSVSPS